LSASDCEPLTAGELLDLPKDPVAPLTALRLGYTESQRDPPLRALIPASYPGLAAQQGAVPNAPEEPICRPMTPFLPPGARVVVAAAFCQSLRGIAGARGCDVVEWPLVETATGWRVDLDHLERLVAPKTKRLVLNAPHNPTGHHPTPAEMDAILAIAARHSAW